VQADIFRLLPSGPPLAPFWRYYGGKFRAAPHYPPPRHETIVEPFAGAAGYACRYPDRNVILVEKYPVVAELWRYLIAVPSSEVRRIPANIEHVDELPAWVPVTRQASYWMVAERGDGLALQKAQRRPQEARDDG